MTPRRRGTERGAAASLVRLAGSLWLLGAALVLVDEVRGRGTLGFGLPAAFLLVLTGLALHALGTRLQASRSATLRAAATAVVAALSAWTVAGVVVGDVDEAFGIHGVGAVVLTVAFAVVHCAALYAILVARR